MSRKKYIDPISCTSLYVETCFDELKLSSATGFVVKLEQGLYLVTNWHVVSGRNAETQKCLDTKNLAIPNKLVVSFHKRACLGQWVQIELPLLDAEMTPLWKEHPLGHQVDVVAIPLTEYADIDLFPIDYALKDTDMVPFTAAPVSIIGYPLGLASGGRWPIWKTGHIASDHSVDYEEEKPAFLIDATTRSGMSGAPVVFRADSFQTSGGIYVAASGTHTRFLGVYAGRIHGESEIGRVWRPFVIREIVENKLIFDEESGRVPVSRNTNCPCGKQKRFKDCCGRIY